MGNPKPANRSIFVSKTILITYVLLSICSPWLASDHKILCLQSSSCLLPIIPHSAETIHSERKNTPPKLLSDHVMGTDILGRDVAAGMIHGSRQSLLSGLASTILGGTIGVILGMMAGFYGSRGVKVHIIPLVLGIIGIGILFFYLWYSSKKLIFGLAMVMVVMFMYMLHKVLNASKILPHWKTTFPIDTIVLKAIEIRKSIPPLFLILALLPIFASPSVWNVVVVLSILIWSDFARYSRAETMNIANTNYIERVLHSGFSGWYILTRHILPNILPTLMVLFCFSVGACILAESSISFLGIGVAATDITWGTILAEGRKTLMWWMIVFPGIAIFLVIWSLNMIVNYLQNED